MAKHQISQGDSTPPQSRLPKDRLKRVNLGKSFAEYDPLLREQDIYVVTPAIDAASSPQKFSSFFVGRRGTGKTAITLYLTKRNKRTFQILPQQFVPTVNGIAEKEYRDTRQRAFRSLKEAFMRAFLTEAIKCWLRTGLVGRNALPDELRRHLSLIEDHDFDSRLLVFIDHVTAPLAGANDSAWLKQVKISEAIIASLNQHYSDVTNQTLLLIDRIDEAWDGSDRAVIHLMAMMHATVELSARTTVIRPIIFLRENIFERVRQVDNEFGRLETSVTSLDWTPELLRELIERRLAKPFVTKLRLHGDTWDAFFANYEGRSSFEHVAEFCQLRPRDVLTYSSLAIQNAVAVRHEFVEPSDFQTARKAFSTSRLKDLSDEYAENFPNIGVVLGRFYGLGTRYTFVGVESFIERLLVDDQVKELCGKWVYSNTQPERFIELLYSIGFFGIGENESEAEFRPSGISTAAGLRITPKTTASIHRSFWDALNLHDQTINDLGDSVSLRTSGVVTELPEGTTLSDYHAALQNLLDELATLPQGNDHAAQFEELVGQLLRLCFFRSLTNIASQVRDVNNLKRRDWICANTAITGFWEQMRARYQATQVIVECKNYDALTASDFQQVAYYMGPSIGRFVVIAHRGNEIKDQYLKHIKDIASSGKDGMVLILREKDLQVFLRQSMNGKMGDAHVQELYDQIVRKVF